MCLHQAIRPSLFNLCSSEFRHHEAYLFTFQPSAIRCYISTDHWWAYTMGGEMGLSRTE